MQSLKRDQDHNSTSGSAALAAASMHTATRSSERMCCTHRSFGWGPVKLNLPMRMQELTWPDTSSQPRVLHAGAAGLRSRTRPSPPRSPRPRPLAPGRPSCSRSRLTRPETLEVFLHLGQLVLGYMEVLAKSHDLARLSPGHVVAKKKPAPYSDGLFLRRWLIANARASLGRALVSNWPSIRIRRHRFSRHVFTHSFRTRHGAGLPRHHQ